MGTDVGQLVATLGHERLPALERASFFVLLRFLEHRERESARIGGDGPLSQEAIRLRHSPDLIFSAGEVESVTRVPVPPPANFDSTLGSESRFVAATRENRYEVVSTMLGLTGGVSPLPTYIAEEIALLEQRNDAPNAFLDLFHHRFLGLLYRAVTKHELAFEFDDTANSTRGGWVDRLLGLCGIDRSGGQSLHFLDWRRVVRVAPLLVTRTRTSELVAQALNVLLGEYLEDAKCKIDEYRGGWTALDPSGQIRLNFTRLGRTTGLGSRVFTPSAAIRIQLAVLTEQGYSEFQKGQPAYFALCEALLLLLDDPLDFELELVVQPTGRRAAALGLARISRDSWLGGSEAGQRSVRFNGTLRDLDTAIKQAEKTALDPSALKKPSDRSSSTKEPAHAR